MKKLLLLLVSVMMMFALVSCDDGPMNVVIDDNNSNSQYNYDLEGKTFTVTIPAVIIEKEVTTTTGNDTTVADSEIPVVNQVYTLTFTEDEEDDMIGTVTATYALVFTSAFDAAYVGDATTSYGINEDEMPNSGGTWFDDQGFNYAVADFATASTGFGGKNIQSSTASGTYRIVENEDETKQYQIAWTALSISIPDVNVQNGTTKSGTYPTDPAVGSSSSPITNWNDQFRPVDEFEFIEEIEDVEYLWMEMRDFGFKSIADMKKVSYTPPAE